MSHQLEGKVTYQETINSIKHMKNEKSPRSDGFTAEFFKFFWKDLGMFLLRSYNKSFDKGELSITQKRNNIYITKGR